MIQFSLTEYFKLKELNGSMKKKKNRRKRSEISMHNRSNFYRDRKHAFKDCIEVVPDQLKELVFVN